jgi:hypothetical protein
MAGKGPLMRIATIVIAIIALTTTAQELARAGSDYAAGSAAGRAPMLAMAGGQGGLLAPEGGAWQGDRRAEDPTEKYMGRSREPKGEPPVTGKRKGRRNDDVDRAGTETQPAPRAAVEPWMIIVAAAGVPALVLGCVLLFRRLFRARHAGPLTVGLNLAQTKPTNAQPAPDAAPAASTRRAA